ncbi:SH3 domain-containing protein [Streptomyces sp. T028]|uniref:SH3 domain-containing protein n=1 Tax=Streptomyces sp. T028 TaxID=3394379 RepID=UPI003A86DAEF
MSLRRPALTRLALATAVGALVTAAAVTPATADDDWNGGSGDPGSSAWDEGGQGGGGDSSDWNGNSNTNGNGNGNGNGNSNNPGNSNGSSWQNQGGGQGGDGGGNGSGNGGNGNGGDGGGNGHWNQGGGQGGDGGDQWNQNGHDNTQGLYRGRVTANTLLLRSKPTRASQVIRSVHRGEIVSIFCKTPGQRVDGNPLWYLLTDGTWAWGAARYIDNIGEAPRWC